MSSRYLQRVLTKGWFDEVCHTLLSFDTRHARQRRRESMIVVSTLVDAEAVTASDLAELYRARWNSSPELVEFDNDVFLGGGTVLEIELGGLIAGSIERMRPGRRHSTM
jgi:hypothetical protein